MSHPDDSGISFDELNAALSKAALQKVLVAGDVLKPEHKKMCDLVHTEGYTQKDAYLEVYPEATEPNARMNASTQLRREDCRRYISTLNEHQTINLVGGVGWKKSMLSKVIMRSMKEEKVLDKKGRPTGAYTFRGDWATKAIDTLNKMDGDNAVNKHEVSGPDGGPIRQVIGFEVIEYDDDDDDDSGGDD